MSIARSGIGWLVASIGALAVSWLASLYFTRALTDPQASLGTFYAFETVVALLVLLANGGLNDAIVKRVSEETEAPELAAAGLVMSGVLVVAFSVVVVLASPLLKDFFGLGGLSVLLVLGTLVAYQVRDTLGALLTSNFNLGRTGVVSFVNTVGQVAVQVGFVAIGLGALALMTGYLAGAVLAGLVALWFAVRRISLAWPSERHFRSLVDYARYSVLNSFVTKFYDNVDIIVITALLGRSATGVYGIGFRFSLLLTVFYTAINRTSAPEISKHDSMDDDERVKEVLRDAVALGLLFGLPALGGFVVLARPIIITFYTGTFAGATLVAVGAVATRIPEGLKSTLSTVLSGMDRPDLTFRGGVILMTTNLVLDLALVPTVGIVGAVVASFVGMSLQAAYLWYRASDLLDLSVWDLPASEAAAELAATVAMATLVYAVRMRLEPLSTPELFGLVGVGVGVYFLLVLAISEGIRNRVHGIVYDMLPV